MSKENKNAIDKIKKLTEEIRQDPDKEPAPRVTQDQNIIDRFIPVKVKLFHKLHCNGTRENPCGAKLPPAWAIFSGLGLIGNMPIEMWKAREPVVCPVCGRAVSDIYNQIYNQELIKEAFIKQGVLKRAEKEDIEDNINDNPEKAEQSKDEENK